MTTHFSLAVLLVSMYVGLIILADALGRIIGHL